MADEFMKGLSIFTGAGLIWMVLAGWYNTPGFEDTQLFGANPSNPDLYASGAIILKEALFYFAIFGALTFWVVVPAFQELQAYRAERA